MEEQYGGTHAVMPDAYVKKNGTEDDGGVEEWFRKAARLIL